MKILKKIFGFKFTVYVWAIAIAILVFYIGKFLINRIYLVVKRMMDMHLIW